MRRNAFIHKKQKEKKRAQQKKFGVSVGVGVFCTCLIIGLLAWGSHHSAVSIGSVRVEGIKTIDVGGVIEIAKKELNGNNLLVWNRANTLWYPKSDIIARLAETFPRANTISVKREGMTAITINITERVPTSLWCEDSYIDRERDKALTGEEHTPTCYFVDTKGFIFDEAPFFSGSTFFEWYGGGVEGESIGEYIVADEVFNTVSAVVERAREVGLNPMRHEFRGEDGYLFFDDDTYLMYPLVVNPDALGTDIVAVLESLEEDVDWEYLDMRFGNKVFFRDKKDHDDTGDESTE
ncbi:MAG: hypothetical protein H8D63_03085 [Parcubacteria group bacterium]|nr:hypothetical protein [Parcubacteria group bacterium]